MASELTDEQCIDAIWELLEPGERPREIQRMPSGYGRAPYFIQTQNDGLLPSIAHRAILDAAREVLERSHYNIHYKPVTGLWWFSGPTGPKNRTHPTRTACTYHALKWLKETEK